jgi:hypothetical protein
MLAGKHGSYAVKFMTEFYMAPGAPDAVPHLINHPTGDFSSLAEAREIAKSAADLATIQAHSIVIESEDGSIRKRLTRDNGGWIEEDA